MDAGPTGNSSQFEEAEQANTLTFKNLVGSWVSGKSIDSLTMS